MTIITYAQNFEDVMLWRALKHIKNGTYVDVGAQHPVVDSVSKLFYEKGWRGVHVEPVPAYAALIRADRPDEVVLEIALGEKEGVLDLHVIPETGLSTAITQYAQRHNVEKGYAIEQIKVPVMTLTAALNFMEEMPIHWLKIDVEGFEQQVLKGWDSRAIRPWILVVEATIPNSAQIDYLPWEYLVIDANYEFVYFDGLNRFYLAQEHADLKHAFYAPPNVFDDYKRNELVNAEKKLQQTHLLLEQAEVKLTEKESVLAQAQVALVETEQRFRAEIETINITKIENEENYVKQLALHMQMVTENKLYWQNIADTSNQQLIAQQHKLVELNHSSHHWWLTAQALQNHIAALEMSRSWRFTAPLRQAKHIASHLKIGFLAWVLFKNGSRPYRVVTRLLRALYPIIVGNSLLAPKIKRVLDSNPRLKQKVATIILHPNTHIELNTQKNAEIDVTQLSTRALGIYTQIKASIVSNDNKGMEK